MIAYVDTSSLLKLLIEEPGSEQQDRGQPDLERDEDLADTHVHASAGDRARGFAQRGDRRRP